MTTKIDELEFHPAANLFPLDEENLAELAEDIKQNGQKMPIELYEGKIIDGRRRYNACQLAGVAPDFMNVNDVPDPVAYVLSLNWHRRHLTQSERAMVAARVKEMYSDAAQERMKAGKAIDPMENLPQGSARDQAGKALGVSGRMVDYGTAVLKNGSGELIEAVEKREVSVSRAAKVVDQPKEKQLGAAKRKTKPKQSKPDYGKCPNCLGTKWDEDEDGVSCSRCSHPWGEPAGDVDEDRIKIQRSKTIKTCEALQRAFDDLNSICPNGLHKEAERLADRCLEIARAWK